MKRTILGIIAMLLTMQLFGLPVDVDLDSTSWTGGLMREWHEINRDVSIPSQLATIQSSAMSHYWQNMLNSAQSMQDYYQTGVDLTEADSSGYVSAGGYSFTDGDFYKWIEGACYAMAQNPNTVFYNNMDNVIDDIAYYLSLSQIPNGTTAGYLDFQQMINNPHDAVINGLGSTSNQDGYKSDFAGTVYSLGHLFASAAIHYKATGKTNLLDVAVAAADYLYNFYNDGTSGRKDGYYDHTIFMGLTELYKATGNVNYINLSYDIISNKQHRPTMIDLCNIQAHYPIREQQEVIGHAQRSNYLWAGLADAIKYTSTDQAIVDTLYTMYNDATAKKMYITGGTGSIGAAYPNALPDNTSPIADYYGVYGIIKEAYGAAYYLPNEWAYAETCANVGMALWAYRMFKITGDAKYIDTVELQLFNAAQAGISRDGNKYQYTNVLYRPSTFKIVPRQTPWGYMGMRTTTSGVANDYQDCQCCPPNIIRFNAMSQNLAYSVDDQTKTLYVNLYGENQINAQFEDNSIIDISQIGDYPWGGDQLFTVNQSNNFELKIRIPEWSDNANQIKLNGNIYGVDYGKGYVSINRNWNAGDTMTVSLNYAVQLLTDNNVQENAGKVTVKRGAVVYCIESPDLPEGADVADITLNNNTFTINTYNDSILGNITTLIGNFTSNGVTFDANMIPYYAWCNRELPAYIMWRKAVYPSMTVWLDYNGSINTPTPTIMPTATNTPTDTPTTDPEATDTPTPTNTNTPEPATDTPTPTPTPTGGGDTTPPAQITTLQYVAAGKGYATMQWTATGDDGNVGTATTYDLRYSSNPLNTSNWDSATQVTGEPVPSVAGTTEIFTVNGLSKGYIYFAIKAIDEAGNTSVLSNNMGVRIK